MVVKFTYMELKKFSVTSFHKLQCCRRCPFHKNPLKKLYIYNDLQTANYLSDCILHSFSKFSDFPTVKNRV